MIRRSITLKIAIFLALAPLTRAWGHGVEINVDLNAAGTKLVTDRTVYADRDITAMTNLDTSLGYDQDDDVPGYNFSSAVFALNGTISLRVIGTNYLWTPATGLQSTSASPVTIDSLFNYSQNSPTVAPVGETVVSQKMISNTTPIALYPPPSDHHFAAYDLPADAPAGAYGALVQLVVQTPTQSIYSNPFLIGLDNGLTHAISSFGAAGTGDHEQPASDGTQYGAAVAAWQSQMAAAATWNVNGGGSYGTAGNWSGNPLQGAASAGTTVTFADGDTTTIQAATATVTVSGAYTAGSLVFDNRGGTSYTLAGDGNSAHGITLNNNGAGASVNVLGGSHVISTNLTMAEPTVFNVAAGGSLLVTSGRIGESAAGTPLYLTGGGTLTINSGSSYTGATTVSGGTLLTSSHGAISTGPLTLTTDHYVASTVNIGASQSIASLSATGDASGSATVNVASGAKLTAGAPLTIDAGNSLQVAGNGTLRVVGGAAPSLGSGASVSIGFGATLELAGTAPVLTGGSGGTPIVNNSSSGGVLASGSNQVAGAITGIGTLTVGQNGGLTVNSLQQAALVIGSGGTLTLDPSGPSGNPLDQASGSSMILASLAPSNSMVNATALLPSAADSSDLASLAAPADIRGANTNAVPEPSTIASLALGGFILFALRFQRRTRLPTTT